MSEFLIFFFIIAFCIALVANLIHPGFFYALYSALHKKVKRNDISYFQLYFAGACLGARNDFRRIFGASAKITEEGLLKMYESSWSPTYILRFYVPRNELGDIIYQISVEARRQHGLNGTSIKENSARLLYKELMERK